jgi:peptidoglycan/xylan/chitin deacetylase (PgdA/CDA1 family)
VPITRRPQLTWPGGARVALWVNPNIEFFGLDDVMPSNLNERVPREHAKIPNVRNWAVRDYGNRVGIWRIMEVLTRYGIRASAALNSEVCDHHPEIIEEAGRLGWELIGHNQTNALRLTEMDGAQERDAVRATIDRIEAASGKRPVGWLGAGLAETWNTLDCLGEAGVRYVCDWVNDDQPYLFAIGNPPLVSLPYSVQTNDVPAYFEMKGVSAGIRGDAAPPVRHALSRRRNGPSGHGDRGAPVCHRAAASDRRARCRARIHLLACRGVARHRLGNRAAFPGAAAESGVSSAL